MSIVNQIFSSGNPLVELLGKFETDHIGFVYAMNFREAFVLTNDKWKERAAGVPHNGFLVAASFDPTQMGKTKEIEQEVILLRVLGPAPLPTDNDMLRTRIEHNQRRTEDEIFAKDERDGLDPMTLGELQYGALRCRILGTFYLENGELRLGSDLENYVSSTKLRAFKPRAEALNKIVNHINPEVKKKALDDAKKSGFNSLPSPIQVGTVRYTSTARLDRGPGEALVPVTIQPSDFLARRTAVLGMTRTGKSNTVKTTVASVAMAAATDDIPVGQIIFDVNGEYANANHQDDGSSIADVFGDNCIRYRAVDTPDFEDLRTNFYEEPAQGLGLIQELFKKDPPPFSGQDLDTLLSSTLEEPDPMDHSEHNRWKVLVAVFRCILHKAGYTAPPSFKIDIPLSKKLVDQITNHGNGLTPPQTYVIPTSTSVAPSDASDWFEVIRRVNLQIRTAQKDAGVTQTGLESSTKGKPWVNPLLESYLNILARENTGGQSFGGYRAFVNYKPYHSSKRSGDVVSEVLGHLTAGKIVILDLSAGPVSVRTVLSKKIARQIFEKSMAIMNAGQVPQNIVVYVEEAHNLIGKKDDLTDTWPRLAKEGAKAKIAFVYATQEPSSIHPNILSNTENWYVTHLNNDDELKALGKFYDFADFSDSLKTAQDVGFARIKTLSSPYVVPTQINRFSPQELKVQLQAIVAARKAKANGTSGK